LEDARHDRADRLWEVAGDPEGVGADIELRHKTLSRAVFSNDAALQQERRALWDQRLNLLLVQKRLTHNASMLRTRLVA
jgi:hypothetical protein